MPDWTRTVDRAGVLARHGPLRYALIALAGGGILVVRHTQPMFAAHPIALLYAFALVAVWVGRDFEGLAAVVVGALYGYTLRPRFAALPVEVTIYLVNASVEWSLMYILRHAYRMATHARAPSGPRRAQASTEAVRRHNKGEETTP